MGGDKIIVVSGNKYVGELTYNGTKFEGPISSTDATVGQPLKVYFSKGNLQYIGSESPAYWKLADNQWQCFGDNGQLDNSPTINRDFFGWGTSGYNHGANCYQPWSISDDYSNYYAYGSATNHLNDQTRQADWGYNAISNGGNRENCGWRTLTQSEWDYLINNRTNSYTKDATVAGKIGMIIYPDDYSGSAVSNPSEEDWAACEASGCVFLPKAGYRSGTSFKNLNSIGFYWSATKQDDRDTYYFYLNATPTPHCYNRNRYEGHAVRLVQDVQ